MTSVRVRVEEESGPLVRVVTYGDTSVRLEEQSGAVVQMLEQSEGDQ